MSDDKDVNMIDSTALAVKARLNNLANTPPEEIYGVFDITKGALGAVVGALNKAVGGDENRYIVLGWLFGSPPFYSMSSKELGDEQWYALYKWVGYWKNEDDNEWRTADDFESEALAVYSAAIRKLYNAGVEEQERAGRDPLSLVDNAVGELGGKVTMIIETEDDYNSESKRVVVPKSLRNTEFGKNMLSKEREAKILEELGYDTEEEGFEF